MVAPGAVTPQEFFSGHPFGLEVFERVRAIVEPVGAIDVRVSRSQVAFRRTRGFAYVWLPGMYLAEPHAEVVLSLALRRRIPSPRWKQVVEPSPGWWMHHLEITDIDDLDDEVASWLREAAHEAA